MNGQHLSTQILGVRERKRERERKKERKKERKVSE